MTSALEVTLPLATSIVSAVSPFETDLVKSACATTDDARVAGRTGSSATEVAAAAAAAVSRTRALGLRSDTAGVLTPRFCHGLAGSQQPTLPAVQPTVHRAQHVDVWNGGRGATHLVDCLTQHSVQAPLQRRAAVLAAFLGRGAKGRLRVGAALLRERRRREEDEEREEAHFPAISSATHGLADAARSSDSQPRVWAEL